MNIIHWEARFTHAPTVIRYCKHCGEKVSFASSGLFRVNAQQKSLDIWLIYKCITCETTWNLTVHSRVRPQSLPRETLRGYHENDADLALEHAADSGLVKRNGAEQGHHAMTLEGPMPDWTEPTRIHIRSPWRTGVSVASLLRDKLGLSRSAFAALCDEGCLVCVSGHDLSRCKLAGEIIVEIRA